MRAPLAFSPDQQVRLVQQLARRGLLVLPAQQVRLAHLVLVQARKADWDIKVRRATRVRQASQATPAVKVLKALLVSRAQAAAQVILVRQDQLVY